jgi:hypothetical protein
MNWPLPTLPDPFRGKAAKGGGVPAVNPTDPLSALWMLASQPQAKAQTAPAQGLGSAYRLAQNASAQSQSADYDKPAASPLSDEASPFNALSQTMRHEQFANRFPWMGE